MWKYLFWIIILDSNRKSPGTSSKSGSNKNRTSPNNKTGCGNGNKVSVTVALDQDVSIMSDLPDYKKELQRLNTIIGKSNTPRAKKVCTLCTLVQISRIFFLIQILISRNVFRSNRGPGKQCWTK